MGDSLSHLDDLLETTITFFFYFLSKSGCCLELIAKLQKLKPNRV